MAISVCPKCQVRVQRATTQTDIVHECNSGDSSLDNEDVLIKGDWVDYTGSATVAPSIPYAHGVQNILQGTRAELEGAKHSTVTDRGKHATMYRQRKRLTYEEYPGIGK